MSSSLASLLGNLPSHGTMLRTTAPGAPPKTYVCDHQTEPPEDQRISTDQTNILIRALTLKKNKESDIAKEKAAPRRTADADAKGKRPAEVPPADEAPAKRASLA
eukprot:CAMPEP_0182912388 /NCGR_PEP_ID=MMETSP0034_2-20130328/37489_1 /TAXON_ID=156128 /ORGANISM="Nephroselmis pyriformis, Strain CCMP717" /LENGTH=104 /DNA_ID=CAMNT_0025049057 /DNA_START=55 /DNA_END=365 /DNA_ORIENTATION=+